VVSEESVRVYLTLYIHGRLEDVVLLGTTSLALSSFPDRTATNREGNYFEMELMGNPQNSNEIAELFLSDLPTGGD